MSGAIPSRRELVDALVSLGVKFKFDSSDGELYSILKKHIDSHSKTSNSDERLINIDMTIESICYTIILIMLLVSGGLLIFSGILHIFRPKIVFCSDDLPNKACVRCPTHANCSRGIAKCDNNYQLIHHFCIFSDEDQIVVSKMMEKGSKFLKLQSGKFECGMVERRFIPADDLLVYMMRQSKGKGDLEKIANKALDHLKNESDIRIEIVNENVYYSSTIQLYPFRCKAKLQIEQHTKLIATFCLILVGVTLLMWRRARKINFAKKTRIISTELIGKFRGEGVITERAIKSALQQIDPKAEKYWPSIRMELLNNPQVKVASSGSSITMKVV